MRSVALTMMLALSACGGSVEGGAGLITGTRSSDGGDAASDTPASESPSETPAPSTTDDDAPGALVNHLPSPLNVLPLGDSITQGNTNQDSYRRTLWRKMTALGYDVDFVGSNHGNYGGRPPHDDFDTDNEGHWGWRADQVLAALPDDTKSYTADVVLMHLGSNDAFQGQSTASTLNDLKGIVTFLRSANPSVIVLLATIIPASDAQSAKAIHAINIQLQSFVDNLTTEDAPVILVDQATGFDATELTYDGVHPTSAGEDRMAAIWLSAIADLGEQE